MNFPEEVEAHQAIRVIQPGQRVFVTHACGEPQTLLEALAEDRGRLRDLEVFWGPSFSKTSLANFKDHFRLITPLVDEESREAVRQKRADYLPVRYFEIPRLFAPGGTFPIDVALVQVSPPDKDGYCSLGVAVDCALGAARSAAAVVAEVNQKMPRTLGDSFLHLSELHYVVKSDRPLVTAPQPRIGVEDEAIAEHVSRLIPDGATLQVGIGAIPEAILCRLVGKRELGIHSGMLPDGIVDLVASGAVTNSRKHLDQGKIVACTLWGTEKLFNFAHDNPVLGMHPVSYTHNPLVICQLENFIAINSALQIDLSGQVNAESLASWQVSGVGGQADWVRGALLSPGGRVIIAMTATSQGGKRSRIVPALDAGSVVTTPRYDVHFVVTEFGIAELAGKTVSQRAQALISIAHPKFRGELWRSL